MRACHWCANRTDQKKKKTQFYLLALEGCHQQHRLQQVLKCRLMVVPVRLVFGCSVMALDQHGCSTRHLILRCYWPEQLPYSLFLSSLLQQQAGRTENPVITY